MLVTKLLLLNTAFLTAVEETKAGMAPSNILYERSNVCKAALESNVWKTFPVIVLLWRSLCVVLRFESENSGTGTEKNEILDDEGAGRT